MENQANIKVVQSVAQRDIVRPGETPRESETLSVQSTDYHFANSRDEHSQQGADGEMISFYDSDSESEESEALTESWGGTEIDLESSQSSDRCLTVFGVVLAIFLIAIVVITFGLGIAYAVLKEDIYQPINNIQNLTDKDQ